MTSVSPSLSPPEACVHLWLLSLDPGAEVVTAISTCLSHEERTRATRFRHPDDSRRYSVARGALRWLVTRYLDVDPGSIRFDEGLHGKPGLAQGVLQLTEHDVCMLAKLAKCEPESTMIGLQFRVWRSKSRQPLEAEFLGFTEELFAIPTETLMVDVLRIHGVRATEKDVSSGGFRALIAGRTMELIGNARVTA
jgi:hypothetical protein